jgi:hypothetical protein
MKTHSHLIVLGVFALALILVLGLARGTEAQGPSPQAALGTGFTYQGQLKKNGVPVNGTCSLTFSLWDSQSNGTGQVGASQTLNGVTVVNGYFTVVLNGGNQFGASAFTGQARWLQTAVTCTGDSSPVTLSRQQLTAAPYALFASAPWVTSGNNLYYNAGNVGIGTTNPTSKVEIAAQDGLAITGYQPFLTLRDANAANKRSVVQGINGDIILIPDSFIGGGAAVIVQDSGNVAIGTAFPAAKLDVLGVSPSIPRVVTFRSSTNQAGFYITQDGSVHIEKLLGSSVIHVCSDLGFFASCSSASEYVPSIDRGLGFPEPADLVSLLPSEKNPYADEHSPFVVGKTTKPCDENLLGFVTDPKHGADGEKKNEHYLPLAIYGYFPAKVTLENGAIHRGDALTSSSRPGYAMKATSACKTIGYALEDADHEGTIQVFAQHGENAAPEVAALRAQVDDLKKQNNALAARLDAIERGQAPLQSGLLPRDVLLWGALAVVGVVVARRWQR